MKGMNDNEFAIFIVAPYLTQTLKINFSSLLTF